MTSAKPTPLTATEHDVPSRDGAKDSAKERLRRAAAPLFAERGIDGVSVKEVADAAAMNISAVSYHFGGKEALYLNCLEQFGEQELHTIEKLLQPSSTLEEFRLRLRLFLDEIISAHLREPSASKMLWNEVDQGFPHGHEVFKNTFAKLFLTWVAFIDHATQSKFLRQDLDAQTTAGIIIGALSHCLRTDKVGAMFFGRSITRTEDRERLLHHLIEISLYGILPPHDSERK